MFFFSISEQVLGILQTVQEQDIQAQEQDFNQDQQADQYGQDQYADQQQFDQQPDSYAAEPQYDQQQDAYAAEPQYDQQEEQQQYDQQDTQQYEQQEQQYDQQQDQQYDQAAGVQAKAMFEFVGEAEGDLSFSVGEIINVIDQSDPNGWWVGELGGQQGAFPSNFVQVI